LHILKPIFINKSFLFFIKFQMAASTPIKESNSLKELKSQYEENIKSLESELDSLQVSLFSFK
jgi:hypothetical protein